jgi:thiopurine S-methyltransferase
MEHEFWHSKWAENQIGFHLNDVHPLLVQFWSLLKASKSDTVLVPLCGKSEDLDWLTIRHNKVIGVELSDIAVRSYFAERFYTPTVTQLDSHNILYQFDELSIYRSDFFTAPLTPVDIIYDRAALVALPSSLRQRYAQRLISLLNTNGSILLISVEHSLNKPTPPFSVPEDEVRSLFIGCEISELGYVERPDDKVNGERVWLIKRANL